MNNIKRLKEDLAEKEAILMEESMKGFEDKELTEEELLQLESIKERKRVVAVEESAEGKSEVPIDDYVRGIDETISSLRNGKLKLLSNSVITKDAMEEKVQEQIKMMVKTEEEVDPNVLLDNALADLRAYLDKDKITSDDITKIGNLPIVKIKEIFSNEFIEAFTDSTQLKHNPNKAKEDLMIALTFYISIGSEMDDINDEIEKHNKITNVMMKLADINIDVLEMITSDESIAEITKRMLTNSNDLNNKYKKYVKNPDAINNIYTQKAYMMEKLVEAYEKVRPEFSDPIELEELDKEIEKDRAYAKIYKDVLDLSRVEYTVDVLAKNKQYAGISEKTLDNYAYVALDGLRKIPEELAIPGMIPGKNKHIKEIYIDYLTYFDRLIPAYNKVIDAAVANGDDKLTRIDIDGKTFGKYLMIVMGKIAKILSKKNSVETSIELSVLFDMTCRLGTELFMLDKLNNILSKLYSK